MILDVKGSSDGVRQRPNGRTRVAAKVGQIGQRSGSPATQLMAPYIAVKSRGSKRDDVTRRQRHRRMRLAVGPSARDTQTATWKQFVADPHAFYIACAEKKSLQPWHHEQRSGIHEVNAQGGDDAPRHPVVAPGPFLGKEREVSDRQTSVAWTGGSVVERIGEEACTLHRRPDAHPLPFDRGLQLGLHPARSRRWRKRRQMRPIDRGHGP